MQLLSDLTIDGDLTVNGNVNSEKFDESVKQVTDSLAQLSSEINENINEVSTKVNELDNSLGVDIKLVNGIPHWSERGADTFSPFSSKGKIRLKVSGSTSETKSFIQGTASVSGNIDLEVDFANKTIKVIKNSSKVKITMYKPESQETETNETSSTITKSFI